MLRMEKGETETETERGGGREGGREKETGQVRQRVTGPENTKREREISLLRFKRQ